MTIRTLTLIRHAQAARGFQDLDRPLSAGGVEQADLLADALRGVVNPQVIAYSVALRTTMTAQALFRRFPSSLLDARKDIYWADGQSLIALLGPLTREVGDLMVVGHQPTIGEAASMLAGRDVGAVATATAIVLDYQDTLRAGGCKVRDIVRVDPLG